MDHRSFLLIADVQQWSVTALWVLSALSIIVWLALLGRYRQSLLPRPRPEAPWGLVDVWGIMLFWFLAVSLAGLVASIWPDHKPIAMMASGAATLAATAAGSALLVWRYRKRAAEFLLPRCWWREVGIAFLGFIAVTPPIFWLMFLLVQFMPYHHDTLDQIQKDPGWGILLTSYFAAGFAAPIGEEFFFRGVLLSWLARLKIGTSRSQRTAYVYGDLPGGEENDAPVDIQLQKSDPQKSFLGVVWPIVVSAAAFALLHLGQGPAPIALLAFGIALGYIYIRTRSLLACIVLHALLNIYSLTWETLNAWQGASG